MSYLDRLRTARYIAPSGTEFIFKFDDLRRAISKKAGIHELPQQDEANVQDLGNTAIRFAIDAYFTGADYDQTADSFWEALSERGQAKLLHPRWGDLQVLPLTSVQNEAFVDGMRRASFRIEFIRVSDIQYPTTIIQVEAAIGDSLDSMEGATSEAYGEQFDPESAADSAAAKGSLLDSLDDFSEGISDAIAEIESVSEEINRRVSEFENAMDQLILTPLLLAQSLVQLYRTPGRAVIRITRKIDGYGVMLQNLVSYVAPQTKSQAATRTLQAAAILAGMAESTLTGDLANRSEAVSACEALWAALTAAIELIESVEGSVPGYSAPADILAWIRDILARAAAMLLEKSFSLKTERRISLEGDRTPFDLVYELYGDIEHLDEFIDQNRLQADEIFLIPRGREVAYYV